MTDNESETDLAAPASMADLKAMETSLKSSMDVKFDEMRDLLLKLSNGKALSEITKPPGEVVSANSNDGESEEEIAKRKKAKEAD